MAISSWHDKEVKDALIEFNTPLEGLSSSEAESRVAKYGKNKLEEPEKIPGFIGF